MRNERVAALVQQYTGKMLEYRKHMHAHPELSHEEKEKAAYIAARLRDMGLDPKEGVGGYGVIAVIEGTAPAPAGQKAATAETEAGTAPAPAGQKAAAAETEAGTAPAAAGAAAEASSKPKCVGLRADIDALPLTECTGLPFASQNPGVAHSCGHDTHAAMLLGAAYVLNELRVRVDVPTMLQDLGQILFDEFFQFSHDV